MKEGTGMGTDDLFKKRRAERQQRKYEYKNPKVMLLLSQQKLHNM